MKEKTGPDFAEPSVDGLFRGFGRKMRKLNGKEGFSPRNEGVFKGGYHQKPSIYQHFSDFFFVISWTAFFKIYICIKIG